MKDKGIMGSKGVSPHLGAQDIQECLAGNCFADELTHFHFHMLTKMHVPNTNHTHAHTTNTPACLKKPSSKSMSLSLVACQVAQKCFMRFVALV